MRRFSVTIPSLSIGFPPLLGRYEDSARRARSIATYGFGFLLLLVVSSAHGADVKELYRCDTPDDQEIGTVSISSLGGKYYLGIEWLRPVGREDIEEAEADLVSDFTVDGYDAPDIRASLLFYSEDDIGGKRDVLELRGGETAVNCRWVAK